MTAGYSGTPLPKKLGIGPGADVLVLGDPLGFDLRALAPAADRAPAGAYGVVMLFCPSSAVLTDNFDRAAASHTTTGAVWVCWPKKSSGVVTDLTEGGVRAHGLAHGRVDVKVAAIDAVWSGLKFLTRVVDRA